jgi:hypothetical protein
MPVRPSEITPERVWHERRRFLGAALGSFAGVGLSVSAAGAEAERPNTLEQISRYNNN